MDLGDALVFVCNFASDALGRGNIMFDSINKINYK